MFPILRRHWALWAAWTLAAAFLLTAQPWGPVGWPEWVACLGSLVLPLDRRTRRDPLLAIGLAAIALLVIIEPGQSHVLRLVVDWFVFIGAVLLGARAVDDQRELEMIAGHIALGSDADRAEEDFRRVVAEEIARSRRHERSFALLAIAPHPRNPLPGGLAEGRVMRRLFDARSALELTEVLRGELHRYAGVVATEEGVLCRVPEVEEDAVDALVKRLRGAIRDALSIEVEVGAACFPRDALTVDDLIAAAETARRAPLERVRATGLGDEDAGERPTALGEPNTQLRDAQG